MKLQDVVRDSWAIHEGTKLEELFRRFGEA